MNKTANKYIASILAGCMLCSCTTMEKFTVNGVPGTIIYTDTPEAGQNRALGTIPADGKLKVEVPSDAYCGILLAQEPGSDLLVPFGTDMKKNTHSGNKAVLAMMYPVAGIGVGGLLGGLAAAIGGAGGAVMGGILGGSGVLALGGAFAGMAAQNRMHQMSHQWNFGYQKQQYALTSAGMLPLQNVDMPKDNTEKVDYEAKLSKTTRSAKGDATSSKSKKKVSTKSKRSLKDVANDVEGEFFGSGALKSGAQTIEEYADVILLISKIDKDHVAVQVVEGSQPFFESPLTYVVTKTKKGGYQLTMEGLSEAVITFTNAGNISFTHPSVNIDDEIYTLIFNGKKSKK